jgi:hypothetical protein
VVLTVSLLEDGHEVGSIVAMRIHPPEGPVGDDVMTRWTWTARLVGQPEVTSAERGTVEHRHGDGTWALLAAIAARAAR